MTCRSTSEYRIWFLSFNCSHVFSVNNFCKKNTLLLRLLKKDLGRARDFPSFCCREEKKLRGMSEIFACTSAFMRPSYREPPPPGLKRNWVFITSEDRKFIINFKMIHIQHYFCRCYHSACYTIEQITHKLMFYRKYKISFGGIICKEKSTCIQILNWGLWTNFQTKYCTWFPAIISPQNAHLE